jgi:hypothetical protein
MGGIGHEGSYAALQEEFFRTTILAPSFERIFKYLACTAKVANRFVILSAAKDLLFAGSTTCAVGGAG